jgi:uncharacterized protein HemY
MIERLLAADAALERGEADAAERVYAQITEADPRNAIAVVGLARVAVARGDEAAAKSLAERALTIDADEAAAERLLESLSARAPEATPATKAAPAAAPPLGGRRGLWGFLRRLLRRA